jgi:hypothetical protein
MRNLELQEGDLVWVVLIKERIPAGTYNMLSAQKVGPLTIIKKINCNAYQVKLLAGQMYFTFGISPATMKQSKGIRQFRDKFLPPRGNDEVRVFVG